MVLRIKNIRFYYKYKAIVYQLNEIEVQGCQTSNGAPVDLFLSAIPSELLKVPNIRKRRKGFITIYKVKNL